MVWLELEGRKVSVFILLSDMHVSLEMLEENYVFGMLDFRELMK